MWLQFKTKHVIFAEIKDAQAISDYAIRQINNEEPPEVNASSAATTKLKSVTETETLFKKKRKGASSQPVSSRVSGLDLLTAGCQKVTEIEIGLGKWSEI